ncbi:MAG: cell division ATP-binding protein FtsE [Erysipelotrichaceae bacterium]|nr:cell division ATP-binding protein FtsE [Erysipelotrichaceae bacterium]MBR2700952.1 cell division ATP-binding protein FtsE [Erysipelotrichaceae bacterium]MBR2746362.1 cell division ATP-binding protein FtsE [Erysipelotrichaceae bacterium]
MVHLQNVSKSYKNGVNALNDITIDIKDGEFVYVIGETGSGKSTFIKLLDGELIPTKGIVEVNGVNVGKLRFSKVPKYRRNIGVVFQDYRLIESKTVFENIAFALEVINKPRKEIRQRVREVLEIIDLEDKAKSFPSELSGGQQQRVTIGRAIANHPKLLIADEPTGNLDPERSNEIVELLEKINQESGTTVIMVTHDINLVNKYRKRTIKFEYGHVVSDSREGGYIAHV